MFKSRPPKPAAFESDQKNHKNKMLVPMIEIRKDLRDTSKGVNSIFSLRTTSRRYSMDDAKNY